MKELTREQELKVIRSLSSDDVLDNGGGRVVFDLDADISRELDLPNKDYVVKVALGDKGLNQNELEVEQYIKHRDAVALAEITAIGHIITIMEKVDTDFTWTIRDVYDDDYYPEDIYDLPSGYISDDDADEFDDPAYEYLVRQLIYEYGWDREEAEDKASSIFGIFCSLDDLYGETSDNAQIGLNADGDWVAFDYGFDPEKGCSEQCSNTRDYIESSEWCDTFINTLIENIYNNPELWEYSPHGLMKDVEEEFFSYIYDDEHKEPEPETEDLYFSDPCLRRPTSWSAIINWKPVDYQESFVNVQKMLDKVIIPEYNKYIQIKTNTLNPSMTAMSLN